MINRLRNVLNWAAFIPMLSLAAYLFLFAVFGKGGVTPALNLLVDAIVEWRFADANEIRARIIIYGYALWVLIQYVVWKEPVFLPWKFKVDEELERSWPTFLLVKH